MKDASFRVYIRLNNIEYSDVIADLEAFQGLARTGRVRLLLRLGLAAANGQIVADLAPPPIGSGNVAPAEAQPANDPLSVFEGLGFNPADFQFGGKP